MKNRKLKAFVSAILSGILIYTCVFPAFAENREAIATSDEACEVTNDEVFNECVINSIIEPEQKYICKATLDDEFEDDSILVRFTNQESLKFKAYTINDFANLGVKSIEQSGINKEIGATVKSEVAEISKLLESELQYSGYEVSLSKNEVKSSNIFSLPNEILNNKIETIIKDDTELSKEVENINKYNQVILLRLNTHSKQNVLDKVKELEKRDDILIAQPNYIYKNNSIPNDTRVSEQWAINKINLPSAWNITTGSKNVKVGVVDTGIKRAHSDLTANVSNTLGYSSELDQSGGHLVDSNGHGTKVAGVIGAVGNNNKGISGVCWNVDLIS